MDKVERIGAVTVMILVTVLALAAVGLTLETGGYFLSYFQRSWHAVTGREISLYEARSLVITVCFIFFVAGFSLELGRRLAGIGAGRSKE